MEKRIELLQEGFAAQNDRRAHKRRREEEVETGKVTTSMKQRLQEQQHRVEALQTGNSKLQFDLSTANTEIKQLKAQLSDGSGKEGELAAEIKRLKTQLKEVIYKIRIRCLPFLCMRCVVNLCCSVNRAKKRLSCLSLFNLNRKLRPTRN